MGSQVLATIASVIMKLLAILCVSSFLLISSEAGRWMFHVMKNADEAVSEADADGVDGVGLGDSLSFRNFPYKKNANEEVSEADAKGVYGVDLGESLSSLEKRSAQPWRSQKNADEAVAEADAEGVYGVDLGDSLSSLEKRSASQVCSARYLRRGNGTLDCDLS